MKSIGRVKISIYPRFYGTYLLTMSLVYKTRRVRNEHKGNLLRDNVLVAAIGSYSS